MIIVEDYEAVSRAAADVIAGALAAAPEAALCVATGNTPMGAYQELAGRAARGALDARQARVFQLDAYLGLAPEDDRSLYGWMLRSFVEPLGIPEARVVRLPGDTSDPAGACAAYDAAVRAAGGFDLSILGLGPNGHLGFNEPPSPADAPTRLVDLTEASVVSNAVYWGGRDRVPRQALTCGMDLLLASRRVLLVVSGAHKHDILRRAAEGPQTPDVPASLLQRAATVVVADRAAWEGR